MDDRRAPSAVASLPGVLQRPLAALHVDFLPSRRPTAARLAAATCAAVGLSLAADATLVALAHPLLGAPRHYPHFRFDDYARLTIVGVLAACAGWPIVQLASSTPAWLLRRLAVVVTLVLFLPDDYLLHVGQPPRAVAVLLAMHVAIALVTYGSLVLVAPGRAVPAPGAQRPVDSLSRGPGASARPTS